MTKNRTKALLFLLPAYIFLLVSVFIPHHHHLAKDFCTNSIEESDPFHSSLIDCSNPNCTNSHQSDKGNDCDDSSCISKIIYLSSADILKQSKHNNGLLPLIIPLQIDFCTLKQHTHLHETIERKCLRPIETESIQELFLTSSRSLRAPPIC